MTLGSRPFIDTPITFVPASVSLDSSGQVLNITLIFAILGWGWVGGSVHCMVTLRSRPFHRHPNHPGTCLGSPDSLGQVSHIILILRVWGGV